ncbi:hypothetical protein [Coraliomargarita akajimensis]|uniref:Uncharacterized protein n=1 Tax=Coraliomargarita akajimensis (strain DSM 45221 / IAM 15411 / JCM 23193 / KCTC 12865 / 04OKA010-24) TaxID=583355 RepID=D5EHL4_CORAD|nr:hypothetical protein [Coraliomargarita akajimensis]ADE54055.1 hypothetical protein Caka_1033 [Coraliomargarita akajimensis DSM 45221]
MSGVRYRTTNTLPAGDSTQPMFKTVALLILVLGLVGCVNLVSDYDSHTYTSLTSLKGEMKVAFEEFSKTGASGEADAALLQQFHVKMSQALEYEAGKQLNDDTVAQFAILDETLRDVIDRFRANENSLSPGYARAKWLIMNSAFDLAIETEREKLNK